ncbi:MULTISPECIES: class I SAM-dependent methyltransferase [Thiorhodovibrio]|uniref:class I SAM-dependent methyltransferase n=1 Tax=Thiorhodovibrio TaxID=61593 RepID=UPI0019112C3F|nr:MULTISPECIES: class I SAM-dependent methyltransferase [Thiorhodovibrio]MBK5969056.1 hypothetical protein [Thiorhodovibrio winogradskyi]WPL15062.1 Trans-aconitate 2-methyltransferase [Thiorhodovibrio litoralis]
MSDWPHGYVTEVPYTYGFYPEGVAARLDWLALSQGANPPAAGGTVLELGCGQGFGLCLMAAADPTRQYIGVDFNPAHIAHAEALAARAGLTNARFLEGDFLALSALPVLPWGAVDYVLAHGIIAWIEAPVRAALFALIERSLRPGGLAMLSYNTLPGWLASHPLQRLMREFAARQGVGAAAFAGALEAAKRLGAAQAVLFTAQPGLPARLEKIQAQRAQGQDDYLFHEYFNAAWTPFYCTEVMAEARAAKLEFLGSAMLGDNEIGLIPPAQREMLGAAEDVPLRELYRDLLTNQMFRRDVFVRGRVPLWSGEQRARLRAQRFSLVRVPGRVSLAFKTGFVTVQGKPEVYQPLLVALERGAAFSLAELSAALPGIAETRLAQALSLLIDAGVVVAGAASADASPARAFNRAVVDAASAGAPAYRHLALPGSGAGVALEAPQMLALAAYWAEGARELPALARAVAARLEALGRQLRRDGQALAPGAATEAELMRQLDPFLGETLPLLQRLGVLD